MRMQNAELNRNGWIAALVLLLFIPGQSLVSATGPDGENDGGTDNAYTRAASTLRDPLWPVGFRPKPKVASVSQDQTAPLEEVDITDWKKAMEQVAIQGVSSSAGNEVYAVINGEIKSSGETVSVQVGNVTFKWIIESISPPSSVKLRRLSVQ